MSRDRLAERHNAKYCFLAYLWAPIERKHIRPDQLLVEASFVLLQSG